MPRSKTRWFRASLPLVIAKQIPRSGVHSSEWRGHGLPADDVMGRVIEAAISGEAWCVGGTLFDLDDTLDDEGRPVNERRAPSRVKEGVEIELKACPYRDERQGKPMNVSALAQVTRHLSAVSSEIAAFRAALPGNEVGWRGVLMTVLDQLARPALFVLEAREPRVRVPARAAVGHKLAAGFFGVVNGLLGAETEGRAWPVNSESLLEYAHRHDLLLGSSEVCAGPPPLIERATELLVSADRSTATFDSARLGFADLVASQIGLGLAWESFDAYVEKALLERLEELGATLKNAFMRSEIGRRRVLLSDPDRAVLGRAEPVLPPLPGSDGLGKLLRSRASGDSTTKHNLRLLLALHEGAILLPEQAWEWLADGLVHYLQVYRGFFAAEWELECRLREGLGFSPKVPMKPSAVVLPRPWAMRWYEAALGHRIEVELPPALCFSLASPRRRMPLLEGAMEVRQCAT